MSALYSLAHPIYFLLYYIVGYRKGVVFENLGNAFPDKTPREIKVIAKRFYRNYSQVLVEMIKTISIDKEALARQVRFDNPHILEELLERNQSVIVMLAHHCNIDWLLLACDIKLNHPMDAVYKPLHDKSMDRLMLETRSRFGAKPIPAKNTIMEIVRRKNETRCFAIVPDQTPRNEDEKFWTRFLNQDTAFFLGVEKIARMTQYPVLFMGVKRCKRGLYNAQFQVLATPPYSGNENNITDRYARAVEAQILEAPSDWLWSHRRWKHKKPLYV